MSTIRLSFSPRQMQLDTLMMESCKLPSQPTWQLAHDGGQSCPLMALALLADFLWQDWHRAWPVWGQPSVSTTARKWPPNTAQPLAQSLLQLMMKVAGISSENEAKDLTKLGNCTHWPVCEPTCRRRRMLGKSRIMQFLCPTFTRKTFQLVVRG